MNTQRCKLILTTTTCYLTIGCFFSTIGVAVASSYIDNQPLVMDTVACLAAATAGFGCATFLSGKRYLKRYEIPSERGPTIHRASSAPEVRLTIEKDPKPSLKTTDKSTSPTISDKDKSVGSMGSASCSPTLSSDEGSFHSVQSQSDDSSSSNPSNSGSKSFQSATSEASPAPVVPTVAVPPLLPVQPPVLKLDRSQSFSKPVPVTSSGDMFVRRASV